MMLKCVVFIERWALWGVCERECMEGKSVCVTELMMLRCVVFIHWGALWWVREREGVCVWERDCYIGMCCSGMSCITCFQKDETWLEMLIRIEIRVVKGHHTSLSRGPICKVPFWKGPFCEETLALALCVYMCVCASRGPFRKAFLPRNLGFDHWRFRFPFPWPCGVEVAMFPERF